MQSSWAPERTQVKVKARTGGGGLRAGDGADAQARRLLGWLAETELRVRAFEGISLVLQGVWRGRGMLYNSTRGPRVEPSVGRIWRGWGSQPQDPEGGSRG